MVLVLCVVLITVLSVVFSSSTIFISKSPAGSTVTEEYKTFIPLADNFSTNITKPRKHFYYEEKISRKTVFSLAKTHQFHGLINDKKGRYYTVDSVVAIPCSITRVTQADMFYEPLPDTYESGSPSLIPCLLSGIPKLKTKIQRCTTETCDKTSDLLLSDDGWTLSNDGHIIILNSSQSDSGWYQCIGENKCGIESSIPFVLSINANMENAIGQVRKLGYVISRKMPNTILSTYFDEDLLLEDKVVYKTLTELEQWQIYGNQSRYTDEVLYLDDPPIHLTYYPTHSITNPNFLNQFYSGELNSSVYGIVNLSNSYMVDFSKYSHETVTTAIQLSTTIITQPRIVPSANKDLIGSTSNTSFTISFSVHTVGIYPDYNTTDNIRCFRNRALLRSDYRTKIELGEGGIQLTISRPLLLDSGYYQCGVTYDIFYISKPVFIKIDPSKACYFITKTIASTRNATLSWQAPINNNMDFYYLFLSPTLLSDYTMFLDETKPFKCISNETSVLNLVPYMTYRWYVTTSLGSVVTDLQNFTTLPDNPDVTVDNVKFVRFVDHITLSWDEIPRSQWYADSIYFTIRVEQDSFQVFKSKHDHELGKINQLPADIIMRSIHSNYSSATITSLMPGTQYNMFIHVCNNVGCAHNNHYISINTKFRIITTTPEIELTSISTKYVIVSVSNLGEEEEIYVRYFKVYSSDSCLFGKQTHENTSLKVSGPIVKVEGLRMGTKYSIQVQSSNGYSQSSWSYCLRFRTSFDWVLVVGPVSVTVLFIVILMGIIFVIKKRYPEFFKELKHAYQKKHLYVYANVIDKNTREDWEREYDVEIIHVQDNEV